MTANTTAPLDGAKLIYDWNETGRARPAIPSTVEFLDETLRDGIQCPSVVDPKIDDKLALLHLMNDLGIHAADLGLPGAGKRMVEDVPRMAGEIVRCKLPIKATCAARTMVRDIEPVVDIAQKTGLPIEVYAFIGSSPIRAYAEEWDLDLMKRHTAEAIGFAVKEGLQACYVTEDTTRAAPETLRSLFKHAINSGARRLCVCDTVGHVTPDGVRNLLDFTREVIRETGETVKIDWHGHNDRGLAVSNAIFAAEYGAGRVHGTALGMGERVGNTALDQMLFNLKLLGVIHNDLSKLLAYCKLASRAAHMPIPVNYPLAGDDAFRTATGVHAAAVIKAMKKGDNWLADRIYSGVPASEFGKRQEIEIGHQSGKANVIYWLEQRRIEATDDIVTAVFAKAKEGDRILTDEEIYAVIAETRQRAMRA